MKKFLSVVLLSCASVFPVSAAGDLFLEDSSFRVTPKDTVVGREMTVYLTVKNSSNEDMKGVVRAFDVTEGKKMDVEQTFTAISNSKGDVFLHYTPHKTGVHEVAIRLIPWENYKSNDKKNDKIIKKFFVDADSDGDGVGNQLDKDDDNDGVKDVDDHFPFDAKESVDTDEDGIGNNADTDDDNDGILDVDDAFPLNASEAGDIDGDGIGDKEDDDDDGDGIRDDAEKTAGTDPQKKDTDGDGVDDGVDDYPLDDNYQFDTDKDGVPNAKDNDDDGDNIPDDVDAFPLDGKEWDDFDKDGIGDFSDPDDDNDGLSDEEEKALGSDPFDVDTDKDGVHDKEDALPTDPTETSDLDNDGLGDNADMNDSNKGPVVELSRTEKYFELGRGDMFLLDAEKSYDPEGGELTFLWEILDADENIKGHMDGSVLAVKFSGVGKNIVRLTVTDKLGETRVSKFPVSVYWSKKDILIGIGIVVLLHLIGGAIWWVWRRRKQGIKSQ